MGAQTSRGGGPRRRLPAAERRALIEDAAIALFTERGYHGTAIDEIARRAGVSPPVLYDHFASKVALHRRLLERTRDELLAMWRANLGGEGTVEQQVARAFGAWAAYVRAHPYAPRMFFRETTGIDEVRAIHAEVSVEANGALVEIIGGVAGGTAIATGAPGGGDGAAPVDGDGAAEAREKEAVGTHDETSRLALAMASEVIRGGLTELAIWWADHPDVPPEAIVATAMNTLWVGFDRLGAGEAWSPS